MFGFAGNCVYLMVLLRYSGTGSLQRGSGDHMATCALNGP